MKEVTRALIINEKGEVLIGLRARGAGANLWALIGGKIDSEESAEACVIREVHEELGLDLHPTLWKEEVDTTSDPGTAWKVYYFVGAVNGTIHQKVDEILETRWISAKDLDVLQFAFGHKRVLQEHFAESFPS